MKTKLIVCLSVVLLFCLFGMKAVATCQGPECGTSETYPTVSGQSHAGNASVWSTVPDSVRNAILEGRSPEHSGLMIIKFGADWCVPCKKLTQAVLDSQELSSLWRQEGITVYEWEVEKKEDFSQSCIGLEGIPTVLFFKNGILQPDRVTKMGSSTVSDLIKYTKKYK